MGADLEREAAGHQCRGIRKGFEKEFEAIRPARKLEWKTSVGTVNLEVEVGGEVREFKATPLQAALLLLFQDKGCDTLTLEDMAKELQCSPALVKQRAQFWRSKGVLREIAFGVYQLADVAGEGSPPPDETEGQQQEIAGGEIGDDNFIKSDADEKAETMRVYWQYIVGMLTNLGALPLERIHMMLGMFMDGPPPSTDELRAFLSLMVREDKLEFTGGMYRLR
ncbi:Anaphase-promoting complex subunit 2 [Spiromyces aspiralis]|uniref:Anaphase-promoting complex subunit 2 n=1 Tax=Spiromyces aspiralis TaxID=68401 RepID=A0ACC1HBR1_9FUNG|nr:Anaphase-promoting complex subunit 2 [Spiromyces aspiralis]